MENKQPIPEKEFKIINDNGEYIGTLLGVSLVDDPAIEKSFNFFNAINSIEKINMSQINDERMEITGPAMIAEKRMLRQHPKTKEYFMGYFTAKQIRACRDYFMLLGRTKDANFNHKTNFNKNLNIVESWIVEDPTNDKALNLGFTNLNKGDWYVTYKVHNIEMWNEIKEGGFNGFSIEGDLGTYKDLDIKTEIKNIIFDDSINDEAKEIAIRTLLKD